MARPGFTQHRKFRRLARGLGSDILARGALELLWDVAYENGDDYIGMSEDVEDAARWTGEPGRLTSALLSAGGEGNAGFIEECQDRPGHFRVHDLYDHAPKYVRARMEREAERTKKGVTISELRSAAAKSMHRKRAVKMQVGANDSRLHATEKQTGTSGTTPAPAPAPVIKTLSVADAPVDRNPSSNDPDVEEVDVRHTPVRELIQKLHLKKFRVTCPWDGSEGKSLERLLDANPSWSEEQLALMVKNRFESDGVTSDRPRKWLANLGSFAAGPQDRYGRRQLSSTPASNGRDTDTEYFKSRIHVDNPATRALAQLEVEQ